MDINYILSTVDHTLLRQTATWNEIQALCDDGIKYGAASVCIPPCYVARASAYCKGKIKICTVIGFPNGYNTREVKVFETRQAVADGADEIDMVINLGLVKEARFDDVLAEIKDVRGACCGKILKVIIETCLLTSEEKERMCRVVTESGADFIKTSTGFSTAGATVEDIKLFKRCVGNNVKIKAAGGIKGLEDAEMFLSLGASRLGTSRVIKAIKESENK
jgi:deoxyribose-phosphate aldolase